MPKVLLVVALVVGLLAAVFGVWWTAVAMVFLAVGQVHTIRHRRRRT